ncbi:flagella assembly protein FlgT [Alteromonas oceanisediminis]|uniref:flagella assembly protein FlgT n=1 Tax=Alteromonas oceanisediminis TaxID=2836180 RepID=UPI001BDA65FA|nr:flagella assembly protein FlgT [Alteromonas oceanisediminis]MBT0584975.1 flagellar assembly protein T N-terminal domain-containing protein [Alteromonas oceanisediminis]
MQTLPYTNRLGLSALVCLFVSLSGQANAAWFQATGQAEIVNGDKQYARQQATQEAIKQALLFAGASVTSVQQLTNGLLRDDRLEVRATGEVNEIELIDEIYHQDYVTVSIRADIFPQTAQCSAATYKKTVVTAHMPFTHRDQTKDGNLFALGGAAIDQLPNAFKRLTSNTLITDVIPERFNWDAAAVQAQVNQLATRTNAQFVLGITAEDVSVHRPEGSLAFWRNTAPKRAFVIRARLFDGMNTELIMDKTYSAMAAWTFSKFDHVDVRSSEFWQSPYGKAIIDTFDAMAVDIDEMLNCEQAVGRVLSVNNNQLQINLGEQHNVQVGDTLTLFKSSEVIDPFGQRYLQHTVHPHQVIVRRVYASTATVSSVDDALLSNIQPNDFVAKR